MLFRSPIRRPFEEHLAVGCSIVLFLALKLLSSDLAPDIAPGRINEALLLLHFSQYRIHRHTPNVQVAYHEGERSKLLIRGIRLVELLRIVPL